MGWVDLLLGVRLNLFFLSSHILKYFLKNNMNEKGSYYSTEQDKHTKSGSGQFYSEPSHSSPSDDASASQSSWFLQLVDVMQS